MSAPGAKDRDRDVSSTSDWCAATTRRERCCGLYGIQQILIDTFGNCVEYRRPSTTVNKSNAGTTQNK
ncbi:hypothetical protein KC340_g42 [Hortaea werneckii]|nr:hypothetical protein KC340_g42 [Hortaea werneckii]